MTVVSDSSPLITLAKIGCFDLLPHLYKRVYISNEVYREVAVDGAGRAGAAEVAGAKWIEACGVQNVAGLAEALSDVGLGSGEVSSVMLAEELSADLVLIDAWRARRYAQKKGLAVIGCIGILENLYERGELSNLRAAYQKLLQSKVRIDLPTLQHSLVRFNLPVL